MLDASFRTRSLMDLVRVEKDPADFTFNATEVPARVENALARIRGNGRCFHFNTTRKNGRKICVPRDYETALLLRRLNANIRHLTKVRQADRHYVVSCIKQICGNGLPFVVAKFDIKKFYDSVNTDVLREVCREKIRTSDTTRMMIDKFFDDLKTAGICGVPAGLALSGTLSEVLLRNFDRVISASEGIHFYSRFVDDIIIIASPDLTDADLTTLVTESLPDGLLINTDPEKKSFLLLPKGTSGMDDKLRSFNYLGYKFTISDTVALSNHDKTLSARKVIVDISPSKIKKRKTRFILSVKQYLRDGVQEDLIDRFLLINSGYTFYDRGSGKWISSGLCNSYPLVDFPSAALKELAIYYRGIFSSPSSKLSGRLGLAPLLRRNRKRIQYFDLNAHVKERKFVGFSDEKLGHLMEVWRRA